MLYRASTPVALGIVDDDRNASRIITDLIRLKVVESPGSLPREGERYSVTWYRTGGRLFVPPNDHRFRAAA